MDSNLVSALIIALGEGIPRIDHPMAFSLLDQWGQSRLMEADC